MGLAALCRAATLSITATLVGCGPAQAPPPLIAATPAPQVQPEPPPPTPEQWLAALKGTFEESSVKNAGDGVTEFFACFERIAPKNCPVWAFGTRDAWKKGRQFRTGLNSGLDSFTSLRVRVFVLDNERPRLMITPYYADRRGWLFLKKVAVMADGEVILEQEAAFADVKRDNDLPFVQERFTFIPTPEQIAALRKLSGSKTIAVRYTGDKGYFPLRKEDAEFFRDDVAAGLSILDKIDAAVKDVIPPK